LWSVRIKSSPFIVRVAIDDTPPQFGEFSACPRQAFDFRFFIFSVRDVYRDRYCRTCPHDAAGGQRTKDGVATAAAIVIFWPAAFFVGGDKQTAAELAQMKGQMVAVEQASIAKKCNIQFEGQRPPGT
jgi:hypothetical protein